MLNFVFSPNILLGFILGSSVIILYFLRLVKPEVARDEDIFLKLGERTRFANENNGDLFISIHANAAEDRRASGFETFLIGPNRNQAAVRVAARENAVLELEGGSAQKLTDEALITATIAQAGFANFSEQFAALLKFIQVLKVQIFILVCVH